MKDLARKGLAQQHAGPHANHAADNLGEGAKGVRESIGMGVRLTELETMMLVMSWSAWSQAMSRFSPGQWRHHASHNHYSHEKLRAQQFEAAMKKDFAAAAATMRTAASKSTSPAL